MPIFVIHEHHAKNLHYDLRLQVGGVLKSWAVPKQPPRTKEFKRLAIQVEDHLLSYAKFEGEIPEGHYGAGRVRIWDNGTFKFEEKTPGKLVIDFKGKILRGRYALIKTKMGNEDKNWLFFKL